MIIGTTIIVLVWALFVGMGLPVWAGVLITIVAALFILLGFLFVVYMFNLDGKLLAALRPLFLKIYDKRKREKII